MRELSEVHHLAGDGDRDERIFDAAVLSTGDVVARGVSGRVYRLSSANVAEAIDAVVAPPTDGILSTGDAVAGRASPDGRASAELPRAPAPPGTVIRNTIIGIAPDKSAFGDVETLVLGDNGSLFRITSVGADQLVYKEPISQVAVSVNGKFLAFVIANTNTLVVSTVDMSSVIAHVNLRKELGSDVCGASNEPLRIMWVGSDAIAAFYETKIFLVGPRGKVAILNTPHDMSSKQLLMATE
eukprot:IDg16977t1